MAQKPELAVIEEEQLEVVGGGDGEGWLRDHNYSGEERYVPRYYIELDSAQTSSNPGLVSQIPVSSVDYAVDGAGALAVQSPDQVSVVAAPVAKPEEPQEPQPPQQETSAAPADQPATLGYCSALFDYQAEGVDELSLVEGQIIRVVSRGAHVVEDGWWRGETNGVYGYFPSFIVEECNQRGDLLSMGEDWFPAESNAPVLLAFSSSSGAGTVCSEDENNNWRTPLLQPSPQLPLSDLDENTFNCNLDLARHQQELCDAQFEEGYDSQYTLSPTGLPSPALTIVVEEVVEELSEDEEEDGVVPMLRRAPTPGADLGMVQTIVSAATPEHEQEDSNLSTPTEISVSNSENEAQAEELATSNLDLPPASPPASRPAWPPATPPASPPASPSASPPASQETVLPNGAFIPDEFETVQLARLQDLEDSNA